MDKIEREKLVKSFIDEDILANLSKEEYEKLCLGFPEISTSASIRKTIDSINGIYFTPYEEEAKGHSMRDLPLSIYDYQRLHASTIDNPEIYADSTMYDLYLALLTHKKIPNIGANTREKLIIALRIFRDFVKDSKEIYPNLHYGILSKDFKQKSKIVNDRWYDICDYVENELKHDNKALICARRKPMVTSKNYFHLTERDYRTKHIIAQYSLLDDLIDGNLEKGVNRLIITK